ncbi:uncharacterized protein LOC118181656 [Stegodyphus dumicola]|uniref:uncharacterized protein LOC118181656 n=1 Tax=Stegodyphus dumicola TaxID=202533 RepID=UPI0015A82303|nr:uncharacterized protein LOC118181656 [Stegodyphus dumicola]
MSKSRIAPLKKLSLPRLELMGAVVAARLGKYLLKMFQDLVGRLVLWTDSEICLWWIKGSAREWKQFVSNRVAEIQDCTSPDKWKYCPGSENPADKLTRGETANALVKDNNWWHGPSWLKDSEDQWPEQKFKVETDSQNLERLSTYVQVTIPEEENALDITKFSSLEKLLRVTAWVKRFVAKLRKRACEEGPLTVLEIQEAEEYGIKQVQRANYFSDIQQLERNNLITPDSKLYSLAPYLDSRGILRVRGRLEQSELIDDEKHPIILPKTKFTELVIFSEHIKVFHSGVMATLSKVRNKFWIPKGRKVVKKVINACLVCKKFAVKPAKQLTGQLPTDRVVQSNPFTVVGIDLTGAVTIREKAARRGSCKVIYSDNAKNFRSTCEIIKGFKRIKADPSVSDFLTSKEVTWKFIPERSPWWGGFWERLMRSIKEPLKKILGRALLTFEELSTILIELECVLNNRPLTYESNELGEPRPLTPSQFYCQDVVHLTFPSISWKFLTRYPTKRL